MNTTSYKFLNKNWLPQFNLYKYESASQKKSSRCPLGVSYILGMLFLISFIVCLVVVHVQSINPVNSLTLNVAEDHTGKKIMMDGDSYEIEDPITIPQVDIFTTQYVQKTKPLRPPQQFGSFENVTENLPTNETEYLVEREDSQPINLRHSRQRKVKLPQPRNQRNEVIGMTMQGIRDQIPRPPSSRKSSSRRYSISNEGQHPRPFNFLLDGALPSEFRKSKKLATHPLTYIGNINNIQDILQRIRDPDEHITPRNFAAVQIAGKYKHFRGNKIGKLFNIPADHQQSTHKETTLKQHTYGDPFHHYKPRSPDEVNLLASNQFRLTRPPSFRNLGHSGSIYQRSRTPDLEDMHHKIRSYGRGDVNVSRSGGLSRRNKPLSVMLDIFPIQDENHPHTSSKRPQKRKKKPLHLFTQGSNLPYSFQLDNSYYNNINFPQVHHSKLRPANSFRQNSFFENQHLEAEENLREEAYHSSDVEGKPSQIMVQLNLFPKGKIKRLIKNGKFDVISPVIDDRTFDASQLHFSVVKNVTSKDIDSKQHLTNATTLSPETTSFIVDNSNKPSVNFKLPNTDVIKFEYGDGANDRNNNF